jgi:hypothetical protein
MVLTPISPRVDHENFGKIRLWRDDIAEMIDVIKLTLPNSDIVIRVAGYQTDNIDDIATLNVPTIDSMEITVPTEKIILTLSTARSFMSIENADVAKRSILTEVTRIARKNRRNLLWSNLGEVAILFLGFWLCIQLLDIVLQALKVKGENGEQAEIGLLDLPANLLTFGILTLFFVVGVRSKPGTTLIYPNTRAEAPTFLSRNSDNIAITVISNVISLILGGVIGYYINKIS